MTKNHKAAALGANTAPHGRRDPDPGRRPIGQGTPGPLGDSVSVHKMSDGGTVVVRRSRRRTRGLSAFWEGGQAVIAVPARLTLEDEDYWIPRMVGRLEGSVATASAQRGAGQGDEALMVRAMELSAKYLGRRAVPTSVRWVRNQTTRWGSATPARGTIRLSHQLQGMPDWVVDYVLLHELTHLIHANHGAAFWNELSGYRRLAEAKAFLHGVSYASARNITGMEHGFEDEPEELAT